MNVNYETTLAPAFEWDQGRPIINGPCIYGASPNKDFLYLIPTVGERPIQFTADGLPPGLSLDREQGVIRGQVAKMGEYGVLVKAKNKQGEASKKLKLVIEDNVLALTPPMGWNSWNCFRSAVTDAHIRGIARGMVDSGLAARGYSYVNIDSGWQAEVPPLRGGPFNSILPKKEFPDMAGLCNYIHSMGLKAGIYSGPYLTPWGIEAAAGSTSGIIDTKFPFDFISKVAQGSGFGISTHEREDVSQWAAWGFDYCKYDWTPTDMVIANRMSRELRNSSRDFVFSVTTQVAINDSAKIRELANLWRSNVDTSATWSSVIANGFGKTRTDWERESEPGHWFDLDMTALNPKTAGNNPFLTRDEMITHVSCWMIFPSPIMIDCEPDNMDAFLKSLLCNEEIIAVNQDSLGKPAVAFVKNEKNDGWNLQIKPLSDGNYVLACFNLSNEPGIVPTELLWRLFGKKMRDLWAREDAGMLTQETRIGVNPHGAKVFKVYMS